MAKTNITPNGQNITIITNQTELGLYISIYQTNKNFKPIGQPEEFGDPTKTEEEFVKGLRAEASLKGHYIAKGSTNREWDPGYIEPIVDSL